MRVKAMQDRLRLALKRGWITPVGLCAVTKLNSAIEDTREAISRAKENEAAGAPARDPQKIADLHSAEASASESLAALENSTSNFEAQEDYVHSVARKAGVHLSEWTNELIERFELCLNGSLGFWVTIRLLAGWSVQKKHGKPGHAKHH